MAKLLSLTLLLCAFAGASRAYEGGRYETPESLLQEAFAHVTQGDGGLGIETIDPLYISYFEGNFATLRYKNYNNTVSGLSSCQITKNIFSSDRRVVYFLLDCPSYVLTSSNEVQGYLMYENMYGRGTLKISYGNYLVSVYAQVNYVRDYYGNVYYQIGYFSLDIDAKGPNKFDFMHLYNDNKYKNEDISKFSSDNWEACAVFSKEPVWYPVMRGIVDKLNKYLITVTIQ